MAFKCTQCGATFKTRDELRKHQFGHLYGRTVRAPAPKTTGA